MTQILTLPPRQHDALDRIPTTSNERARPGACRRTENLIEVGLAAILITAAAAAAGVLACEAFISLWGWGEEIAGNIFADLARWFRTPRAW